MDRTFSAALVLGTALVLAALVFGLFFYSAREARDTVQVVGAATRQFETDVAKWRVTLSRSTGLDGLGGAYDGLSADVQALAAQLRGLGLPDSAVTVQPPHTSSRYDNEGRMVGYEVSQSLVAVSGDVGALEQLALNPGRVESGGAFLQGSSLEYFYDDLDTLKHALLAEATADARARAEEIAGAGRLGGMTSGAAGVFQITEPYSTEVASYGIHSTASRKQEITVTVRATFTVD